MMKFGEITSIGVGLLHVLCTMLYFVGILIIEQGL